MNATIFEIYSARSHDKFLGSRWLLRTNKVSIASDALFPTSTSCIRSLKQYLISQYPNLTAMPDIVKRKTTYIDILI